MMMSLVLIYVLCFSGFEHVARLCGFLDKTSPFDHTHAGTGQMSCQTGTQLVLVIFTGNKQLSLQETHWNGPKNTNSFHHRSVQTIMQHTCVEARWMLVRSVAPNWGRTINNDVHVAASVSNNICAGSFLFSGIFNIEMLCVFIQGGCTLALNADFKGDILPCFHKLK